MRASPLIFLVGIILMNIPQFAVAADFPEPDQLPAAKEFPDPLVTLKGERITTEQAWFAQRRPELLALFQHYMYGPVPNIKLNLTAKVVYEDRAAFGGKATLREVAITPADGCPPLYLLLVTPNDRPAPVPAFVGMNFTGNHTLVTDPKVRIPDCWIYAGPGMKNNRATEEGRGKNVDTWAIDDIVAR